MHVQKTVAHGGMTLAHGSFEVRETVYVCATGCKKPGPDGQPARALIQRQSEVASILLPRSTVGYDVMTFVGVERFVHFRQREEIVTTLEHSYGLSLSSGEVSDLCRRFLVYLNALHEARAGALRQALEKDGGWPLHIDATGEDGRGTLLCAYAGWRGWALGAWKIPTERADAMLPKLRAVTALFGEPCAVMRDFGRAVIEAARDLVAGFARPIPVLGCHLHFLKDIGKDLLCEAHDALRTLFRRFAVQPRLRALARDLGRSLGTGVAEARRDVADWLAGEDQGFRPPEGKVGLAVVRALGQWVLDYPHDGSDEGFPFDRPFLDLYRRCLRSVRAVESLLRKPCDDARVRHALERLHGIVAAARSEPSFHRPAQTLERRARLHDELREALRLRPKAKQAASLAAPANVDEQMLEIRDVQKSVEELTRSLVERRPERGPAEDEREAIDLTLDHLERHGPSLWGHAISLPKQAGGGVRLVERTNVLLENFWHEVKHGERRRSGRKVLSQDFEQLPAEAILARNLTRHDYVAIVCGTLDDLPRAFAGLDAAERSLSLPARLRAAASRTTDGDGEIISASLPKADRDLVRTLDMRQRIEAEARSRAPHRPSRRRAGQRAHAEGGRRRPATVD